MNFFTTALEGDASFPYRWSDLGEALLASDDVPRAAYCFRRALELAPRDPQIRLRAANFAFRTGDTERALRLDSEILAGLPDYDSEIFSSYVRMGGDLPGVLRQGIGRNPRAAAAFLDFLAARPDDSRTETTWAWLEQEHLVNEALARSRIAWLLARNRTHEAAETGARALPFPGVLSTGDWHIDAIPGVSTAPDSGITRSGKPSLRVSFDRAGNVDFHHVSRTVALRPGRYRLSGWLRTEDLSTDQGVALRAGGESSRMLTGTNGWTEVTAEFEVRGAPAMVRVELVRRPSERFENRIAGTVWVADVSLSVY